MKYARHQKNPNLERQLSPTDILLQVQSSLFISTCADPMNRKDFDQPAHRQADQTLSCSCLPRLI